MGKEQSLSVLLRAEAKRRIFEESFVRIKKCLSLLSYEQIWQRPNASLVSVGNLTLHCMGNARQWIGAALGGLPDERKREQEFGLHEGPEASALIDMLDTLQMELEEVIDKLSTEDLEKKYHIQGFEENGLAVLVHVVEHCSYHTGQISWFTKLLLDTELNYYDKNNLNDTISE